MEDNSPDFSNLGQCQEIISELSSKKSLCFIVKKDLKGKKDQ